MVYAFERDFVSRIRSRSLLLRLRPLWARVVSAGKWAVRAAFGAALIASALLVWLAVIALTSSRDSDRCVTSLCFFQCNSQGVVIHHHTLTHTRTRTHIAHRRDGGGFYGGPRGFVFIDPTDIFLIWDPYYSRHSRERADAGDGMTFVEAVFSFVFGDGDPNADWQVRTFLIFGGHL